MRKSVLWGALVLAAGVARAHEPEEAAKEQAAKEQQVAAPRPQQKAGGAQAAGPTSDAFNRACIDLLNGRTPEGEKAIQTLKEACSDLMAGRANDRIQAEKRRQQQVEAQEQLRQLAEGRQPGTPRSVEPGQAAAPAEPGNPVMAAFSELTSNRRMQAMGMRRGGPVSYTIITNPIGWFNGLGVNGEVFGAFRNAPKFSWIGGARYSQTDVSNGNAKTFGAMAGADWFVIGRNNEGLRLGPRVEVAAGRESIGQGDTTFGRMGLGGEVGYNFIATNGITGLVAGGLGGRVAGDEQNEDFESFVGGEFGPYAKIGFGFSW
jgi:hypothetical protein